MTATDPLLTLGAWMGATDDERAEAGAALAAATGFSEGEPVGTHGFRALEHPTGLHLVAIPGGVFWSGLTDADLYALFAHLGGVEAAEARWSDMRREVERASPEVARVAPFLCAAEQWAGKGPMGFQDEPWNHLLEKIDATLTEHSARLPAATEWEWIAREGGATPWVGVPPGALPIPPRKIPKIQWGQPNGFGVGSLHMGEVGELVDDGDERALRGGHGMWQDSLEAMALLCGYDWRLTDQRAVPFRFAFSLDLPAPAGEPDPVELPDDAIGDAVRRFRAG